MKISKSGNQYSELLDKLSQIIPDDGFADGGEPYTNDEMDLIYPEEKQLSNTLSMIENHLNKKDYSGVQFILEEALKQVKQIQARQQPTQSEDIGNEPPIGGNPGVGGASSWAV